MNEIDNAAFIREIIDDLNTNGYYTGGKASTMLNDWLMELEESKVEGPLDPTTEESEVT